MAVTAKWFGNGLLGQYSSTSARRVDWVADTVKVALVSSSYTPNQDADDFWNDANANEITGTGYTAGGISLASKTVTYDGASNTLRLDADNVLWTTATFTCRYGVVYKDTTVASTSPLLGYVDFGGDEAVSSTDFQITWDADGVLRLVAA